MKRCTIVGIVVLMMLAVVACDQESSLQDAIDRAIAKTSEASYRSAKNSTTYKGSITYRDSSEVEYAAPDRYHSLETSIVGDAENVTTMTRETIVFGDKAYWRSLDEPHQWHVCEVYTSDMRPEREPKPGTTCFLGVQTLESKLERFNYYLVEREKLPDEEIDGVNCSHYRGRVDQDSWLDMQMKRYPEFYADIPPEELELMRQLELSTEFWIDGDDHIRQHIIQFRFRPSQEEWGNGFSITRYFDIGEPISIEPPEME